MSGTKPISSDGYVHRLGYDTSFSAKDICDIIQTCASSKVAQLDLGEIKIKFQQDEGEGKANPAFNRPASCLAPQASGGEDRPLTTLSEEDIREMGHLTEEEKNEMADELKDYELMTNDPMGYELKEIGQQLELIGDDDATDGYR